MKQNSKSSVGEPIAFEPIGFIHSEHTKPSDTPIQPVFAAGCRGRAEIFPQYEEGLRDLEGFSHIHILFHLHKAGPTRLTVKPFLEDVPHGVFATCAPCRPNPIGLSLVRLIKREGNILFLDDLDILDSTPILDIKPYVSRFGKRQNTRDGWQEKVDDKTAFKRGRRGYKNKTEPKM
jgi:tRNA (adenine37-N6)-methyltransferase